jgi:hypothetical protein
MLQALDSARYVRFVRRFGVMLRSRSGTRTNPVRAVAPELVERRHRALRKAMKRAVAEPDARTYHRLRIVVKRFRYALEFFSEVYPGQTALLVRRAVSLQDLLGAYQDADVAISRLRELSSERGDELGPDTVFAMGEIAGRGRPAIDELGRRVARSYAKLAGNDWKKLRKQMNALLPPQGPARVLPPPTTAAQRAARIASWSTSSTSRP